MRVAEKLFWMAMVILMVIIAILGLGLYSVLYSIALLATWLVEIFWQAGIT